MNTKAMKQALEALEGLVDLAHEAGFPCDRAEAAITSLRQAIANPDFNAAKAEIIQAERERLAMLCERLPFGNTAHSFAAWIRNGGQA